MKKVFSMMLGFSILFFAVTSVSAHVVVKPNEVKQSAYQTFTIGVPNEKESATTSIQLIVPEGLRSVMPNVKPGWEITVVKSEDKVTEINWTRGKIPVGQRDEFLFSAQAPAEESTIEWKAFQTYADGTVVAWDKTVSADSHGSTEPNKGPASQTKVIKADAPVVQDNHMSEVPTVNSPTAPSKSDKALPLSLVAVALSAFSLGLQFYKRK